MFCSALTALWDRFSSPHCRWIQRWISGGLIGLLLILTACSPTPQLQQRLVQAQISDPQTFNIYISSDNASNTAISPLFLGLTSINEDTLQPQPELAESWQVEEGGLRYIFTLREDLQWSDGEPLTAEDVDFTYNDLIFNEQIPTSSRDVKRIGGLPPGLTIDDSTGEIFGIPIVPGTYNFTVLVTDQAGQIGKRTYRMIIAPTGERLEARLAEIRENDENAPVQIRNRPRNGIEGEEYRFPIRVQGGEEPYQFSAVGALPQVRLLDQRRIEFELPEPFAPFLEQAGSPILPKHILQNTIEQVNENGEPLFNQTWGIEAPVEEIIGAGPFTMTEYSPNQRIVYAPNPYYWKSGPELSGMILRIVESLDTVLLQFRSRELDLYTVRGSDFQLLKQEEERDQFTIYNLGPTLSNNFMCLNQSLAHDPETGEPFVDPIKSQWFTDVRFRRALAHAIDKQGLVDSILRGLGQPQNYTISPASPFHLSPEEGAPIYEYDPAQARRILISAGYEYDEENRLIDPDGNRVRFSLNTNSGNNEREAAGALIKAYLEQIGITIDFTPIAFSTLVQKMTVTRDWDAVMLSFGGGGTEPNNGSNIWRSTGRLHIWNLGNQPSSPAEGVIVTDWEKEIDRIFAEGTRILEFEERQALYDQFQIITQEQLPLINTFNPLLLVAIRDRVENADPRPIIGSLWNLEELEIEP